MHTPVDVRCRPVAYCVQLHDELVGCLIFGRPEATRVNGWYGSLEDVLSGKCRITRWQVLNLARVWLHPDIQHGGPRYIPNAASTVIAQALRRIVFDYLLLRPPVYLDEPYEIRECLSYCDSRIHNGALYRASNFRLVRTNERGIETYVRSLRHLTHAERQAIHHQSKQDWRACQYRLAREYQQLSLF